MSVTMQRRRPAPTGTEPQGIAAARQVSVAPERRDPVRRRWGRIGGGVFAAVLGGWLFASLYLSAGDRIDVLAVATKVGRYEVIERSDLRVVSISKDSDVSSIPAARLDDLVGRVAATDLTSGSLLADGALLPPGERLVQSSEAVVGVLVKPGDSPTTEMRRGATVSVVVRPPAGTGGAVTEVPGWLVDVGSAASNGDRTIEVVVARTSAAAVSAAAADRRVTIVALGD